MKRKYSKNRSSILFDVGGVLTPDFWETILLTPDAGLADKLGLPRDAVGEAARLLWTDYSRNERVEKDYWNDLGRLLSVKIDEALIKNIEDAVIVVNEEAQDAIKLTIDHGLAAGIVSNNTSFWYRKQMDLLNIESFLDPKLIFLSHKLGVVKGDIKKSMFSIVATEVEPQNTLVIEDRNLNVIIAQRYGFHAIRYKLSDGTSLCSVIKDWLDTIAPHSD